jgi:hypothetical protein
MPCGKPEIPSKLFLPAQAEAVAGADSAAGLAGPPVFLRPGAIIMII